MVLALALALAGSLGLASAQGPTSGPEIDFASLGATFVAAHCPPEASPACPLEDVLARDHARLDIGPFTLEFPKALLADKDALANVRGIAGSLAAAALEWVRWQGAGDALPPEQEEFWPKWIGKWKALKPADLERATSRDLVDAIREGFGDLGSTRADVLFIGLIYAVAGLVAARAAFHYDMLPLLFPMVSGFALQSRAVREKLLDGDLAIVVARRLRLEPR